MLARFHRVTIVASMRMPKYAVVWRERAGPLCTGSLELHGEGLRLAGSARGELVEREVPYREIAAVRLSPKPEERIEGRQTLVLDLRTTSRLQVASVGGLGHLRELAELISPAIAGL